MAVAKGRKRKGSEDSDEANNSAKRSKGLQDSKPDKHKDEDGNPYWEISSRRRLGVSEYKGKTMINLREYYEKDGRSLPGKAGISLVPEQLTAFVLALPELTAALAKKGVSIPRPNYDAVAAVEDDEEEDDNDDDENVEEEEEEEEKVSLSKGKKTKKKKPDTKRNIDATSDEDDLDE